MNRSPSPWSSPSLPTVIDDVWRWGKWGHAPQTSPDEAALASQWWLEQIARSDFDPNAPLSDGRPPLAHLVSNTYGRNRLAWEKAAAPLVRFPIPGESGAPMGQGGHFIEWVAAALIARGADPWFQDENAKDFPCLDPIFDVWPSLALQIIRHPASTPDRLNAYRQRDKSLLSIWLKEPELIRALADKGMDLNVREKVWGVKDSWCTPLTRCSTIEELAVLLSLGADPTQTNEANLPLNEVWARSPHLKVGEQKKLTDHLLSKGLVTSKNILAQGHAMAIKGQALTSQVLNVSDRDKDRLLTTALAGVTSHNKLSSVIKLMWSREWPRSTWMQVAWLVMSGRPLKEDARRFGTPSLPVWTVANVKKWDNLFQSPSASSSSWEMEEFKAALPALIERLGDHPLARERVLNGLVWSKQGWGTLPDFFKDTFFTRHETNQNKMALNITFGQLFPCIQEVALDNAVAHIGINDVPAALEHHLVNTLPSFGKIQPREALVMMFALRDQIVHGFDDGTNAMVKPKALSATGDFYDRLKAALPEALALHVPPGMRSWGEWLQSERGKNHQAGWDRHHPEMSSVWSQSKAEHRHARTPGLDSPPERPRVRQRH